MEALRELDPSAIVLSGGPASVTSDEGPSIPRSIFDRGVPILGICYGQQVMCSSLGGEVVSSEKREFGRALLEVVSECELFDGIWRPGEKYQVWMSHGDCVVSLPNDFFTVGSSENAPFAAIANERKNFYGVQFHPEVAHTPDGSLLRNFTHKIANISPNWTMARFRDEAIRKIHDKLAPEK